MGHLELRKDAEKGGEMKMEMDIQKRRQKSGAKYVPPGRHGERAEEQYEGESARQLGYDVRDSIRAQEQGGNSGAIARVLNFWIAKYALGDCAALTMPREVKTLAKQVNSDLTREVREKIRVVDDDDPDKEFKIYEAKVDCVMRARIHVDMRAGCTERDATDCPRAR